MDLLYHEGDQGWCVRNVQVLAEHVQHVTDGEARDEPVVMVYTRVWLSGEVEVV